MRGGDMTLVGLRVLLCHCLRQYRPNTFFLHVVSIRNQATVAVQKKWAACKECLAAKDFDRAITLAKGALFARSLPPSAVTLFFPHFQLPSGQS